MKTTIQNLQMHHFSIQSLSMSTYLIQHCTVFVFLQKTCLQLGNNLYMHHLLLLMDT